MKLDVAVMSQSLRDAETLAQAAEAIGFDTLWTSETQHDPFLPLGVAALSTQRIGLGTAIAVAFARNPTSVAHLAWDLQAASGGRFRLGLGTQVQAHIERRFGMPWGPPAARLREFILAMRAVWEAWQTGGRLNFRGEYYKLTLMAPFFNPGPLEQPQIPVYIAAVNAHMCELAGELCQGLHVHPFHTTRYLREQIVPHVQTGLEKAGRRRDDIALSSSVFIITGQTDAELAQARAQVRSQVAFYASTPTYSKVMDLHGWSDIRERLSSLAVRQRWEEMSDLISDEMLAQFAVEGRPAEIPYLVKMRYVGLLERVTFYLPFDPAQQALWRMWVEAFN
ncbi:MAG: TIGR03617 family F420-dependent LLM class oxidoreductase [Anaerolineae bacterium]